MHFIIPTFLFAAFASALALPADAVIPGVTLVHSDPTPAVIATGDDAPDWFNTTGTDVTIEKRQDDQGRFRILLCADANLGGRCIDFGLKPGSLNQNGRDHCWNMKGDLSGFNDVISSVKPLNGGAWFVWPDYNCNGDGLTFRGQVNDFQGTGLNDRISSISVTI